VRMTLVLNDDRRRIDVGTGRTLLDVLLAECDLPAVRHGCADGTCGDCTVLIEGEPTRACLMFAVQCDGSDVRA